MHLHATRPGSDITLQCATLAHWFHEHGIAWSGTPAELASELSQNLGDTSVFTGADELVALLETNAPLLREMYIEASVRKPPGLPRTISLRAVTGYGTTDRLDIPNEDDQPVEEEKTATPAPIASAKAPSRRRRMAPVLFALCTLLVVATAVFAFAWRNNTNPLSPLTTLSDVITTATAVENKPATVDAKETDPQPSSDSEGQPSTPAATPTPGEEAGESGLQQRSLDELFRDATERRLPSSQHELGMRYAEGRGVQADNVTAYAWLVLARSNGSTQGDPVLRKLSAELSPVELQQVRVSIGRSYAEGLGVPRDYVVAHSWFSLAELAGSTEATALRRRIEERMTTGEIEQARSRTNAWLSRH